MSSKFCSIVISSFLISTLVACGGGGGGSSNSPPPAASVKTVEEAMTDAVLAGADGAFLYIEQAGDIQLRTAGQQDINSGIPASDQALFRIASISKLFVAVAVAKLIDDGLLSADNTFSEFIPEYSSRIANSQSISIRMMTQHRSGIPDFDSAAGFDWQNAHPDIITELERILDLPADFLPDTSSAYSNSNYLLLGLIMDEVLGYDHADFIQAEILTPLGLLDTYYQFDVNLEDDMARGHWLGVDRTTQAYTIPGGSMISTLSDVGTFVRALNTGGLLTDSESQIYSGLYGRSHSGWLPGYQSNARFISSANAVVVLFINETGSNTESIMSQLYEEILQTL